MNSKERVKAAINLKKPDRIPMDFSANKGTLGKLYEKLEVNSYKEVLDLFKIDIIDIRGVVEPEYEGPVPKEVELSDNIKKNFWGMKKKTMETATGPEDIYVDFIFEDAKSVEDYKGHRWPEIDWFDFSSINDELDFWDDFAIMASGASVFQHPTFLRGFENLLTDMVANKEMANYLLDKFTDFYLQYFDRLFSQAGDKIDIFRIADDLGMQDRPLMSLEMFEEMIVPRLDKLIDMAHSHDVKVMFHSCGSIDLYIEKLIEIGIDILDPIQVKAKNMKPKMLKKKYGDRICFHGGIDTQYVLPTLTEDEVKNNVTNIIDILGEGGGFILAPSHVLQTDVPLSNIKALYETGYKYGKKVLINRREKFEE